MNWQLSDLDIKLIELALIEDLGKPYRDITTEKLFAEIDELFHAKIISKHAEPIIISGLPVVQALLNKFSSAILLKTEYKDGDIVYPGKILLRLTGPANILLMAERTILNFLQHLCAVSTLTAKFVERVKETGLKILDTRKTTPGFRHLDKYAVHCGGGVNHRTGLYDAILIKDTHIDLLGGIAETLLRLPDKKTHDYPVIIEIRTKQELSIVISAGLGKIDRVLLDNMSLQEMRECVSLCQGIFPTEASGNISLDNIKEIAETGVNFASIGKLTHSAGNVDLSMQCR